MSLAPFLFSAQDVYQAKKLPVCLCTGTNMKTLNLPIHFCKMIFYTEAKELQASLQVTLLLRSAPSLIQLLGYGILGRRPCL